MEENKLTKKLRIVLADDEAFIRLAYKDGLERAGFEISVAENGEEALKLIREKDPDLILLDLIMPKVNGFEVLKELKKDDKLKDKPVIIMSNLSQDSDEKEVKSLGAKEYIVKSNLSLKEVVEKIKNYM